MKLKSVPEDFRVEEISDVEPSKGQFGLYRLEKCGLGTPEAIQSILHKWQLARADLSYGGMKDRHADTTQYLTIFRGPKSGLTDKSFTLEYLGQCPRAYHSKNIVANRFDICLRRIDPSQRERLNGRCQLIQQSGVVNYFDDQRFGSIGYSGDLIGVSWCLGNYERALYLSMAEPNQHDRPREKDQKEILRDCWGDWLKCKALLDRSHRRSVVTYLCDHPTDFKRALALVRQDLRGIYISAFQSWVWNRWLSKLIEGGAPVNELEYLESRCGKLAMPLNPKSLCIGRLPIEQLDLPLPSARQHSWPTETLDSLEQVLAPLNMDVHQMRLKYPRDTFFSRGMRTAWLHPKDFSYEWAPDQFQQGFESLLLKFTLPRGAYATMVVRCLFQEPILEALLESSDEEPEDFPDEQHLNQQ
ncbi:MAG: tRNA pseudouridine(13) synthase TruD [Pirellula sp.]